MKRIYVNEQWCLGCHLCEYICAFANSGQTDMVAALKDKPLYPRLRIEGDEGVTYAVSCRHCEDPLCVKSCIAAALHRAGDGSVRIDHERCVGCGTCILVCPYGALAQNGGGVIQKCELCLTNNSGAPACVRHCPNGAIVYEER